MADLYISNKMTSKYSLIGYRESEIEVDLLVGNYIDSEIEVDISVKGIKKSEKIVELDVKYGNISDIEVDIQPIISDNIEVEIEVAPHNTLHVKYDLKEPPIIKNIINPVADSFVVEQHPYSSINYGRGNSMLVGIDDNGTNEGFIKFDTSTIDNNSRVKKVTLRLYAKQINNNNIELSEVNELWDEYNITYLNKPTNTSFMTNVYTSNEVDMYIEIDVTDVASKWIKGYDNNGLMISSRDIPVYSFRTRETSKPPELIVETFSSDPVNSGRSNIDVEVISSIKRGSSIDVDIEAGRIFDYSDIEVDITTRRISDIYTSNIEAEITYVKNAIGVEIESIHGDNSDVEVEISCGVINISDIEVEIESTKLDGESEIEVEIISAIKKESNIEVEITSSKRYIDNDSNIEVEVDVLGMYNAGKSSIEVDIESTKIYNDNSSDIEVEIFTPYIVNSDIEVDITHIKRNIEVEITVPLLDSSDIEVDVRAKVIGLEDIEVEIEASSTVNKIRYRSYII